MTRKVFKIFEQPDEIFDLLDVGDGCRRQIALVTPGHLQNIVTNITAINITIRDCSLGHIIIKSSEPEKSGQFRNSPHVRWAE